MARSQTSYHPHVLDPDLTVLTLTEGELTTQQLATYQAFVRLSADQGERISMVNLGEHLGINGGSCSRNIRRAQAIAEAKGWKPKSGLKVDPAIAKKNISDIEKKLQNQVSTFVITWAQNASPVHAGFLASLEQYCKHRSAKLIVIAGRYRNPTSIWSRSNKKDDYWADEVAPYLLEDRVQLNDNLVVMGDIKVQPTAEAPLTGFKSITGHKSGIFGHAKVALEAVATAQGKWPKLLTTTGAVTKRNYGQGGAGKKGEFHHTFGATVVEIQGDMFHMRQINACEDGSFIDLQHEYTPKKVKKAGRALGLVLGDIHTDFVDPKCEEAIFGKDGLVDFFNPKNVVLHDWYDGYSGSHHHKNQMFTQLAKHRSGKDDVRAEIMRTFEKTKSWVRPGIDFHIVDSNHNQHLVQWIQNEDPRKDLRNLSFWAEIVHMMDPEVVMLPNRAHYPNPLQLLSEKYLKLPNLHFLSRGQDLMIADIDCSHHGHKGANGARGSINAFSTIGNKSTTGHGHSPGIKHGHHRVGTNSYLDLEYTGGLSSWLQTDEVIYANGKRSLIHKLNGQWRAIRRRT